MSRTYSACLHPVANRGVPPISFLDQIVDTISTLPDVVFTPNENDDIYSKVHSVLGPTDGSAWTDMVNRKAAMCEVLRVLAGEESSWNWNCGADTSAGHETPEQEETGAFQVSADSLRFDPSLPASLDQRFGTHDTEIFIYVMKQYHDFSVEYVTRLLRFNTSWDGPIDRGVVQQQVRRDAMAEFQSFLTPATTI